MSESRVRAHGKQLKMDGEHWADCATEEAAKVIAICINHGSLFRSEASADDRRLVDAYFA